MTTIDEINIEIKRMGYAYLVRKREEPNFYRVADGAIIRVYPIIDNIVLNPNDPTSGNVNAQNVISVYVPESLRGTPSERDYSNAEIQANIEDIDIGFEPLIENFNEYEIEEKWILSVRTIVSQISKTKLFGSRGEPIYIVRTAPIPKFKPKQ